MHVIALLHAVTRVSVNSLQSVHAANEHINYYAYVVSEAAILSISRQL